MMDGGRLGPALRAFRHSPPQTPPSALRRRPAGSQRGAGGGLRRPRKTGAPPEPQSGVSGGEEGRAGGRAEGPAAGWGQRRGQRSHWHAAPASCPPLPVPAAPAPRGAQRTPPSSPNLPATGLFPLPAPPPPSASTGSALGICGDVGRGRARSPGSGPGVSAGTGMRAHMAARRRLLSPGVRRDHQLPPSSLCTSADPPAAALGSVAVQRGEPRVSEGSREEGRAPASLCCAGLQGSRLEALPLPAAAVTDVKLLSGPRERNELAARFGAAQGQSGSGSGPRAGPNSGSSAVAFTLFPVNRQGN